MVRLLAFKGREEAMAVVIKQFKIKRSTAMTWCKEAEKAILALSEKTRGEWFDRTIQQLDACVEELKGPDRLRAIAQRTALLGLNAPRQLHVSHEVVYQTPDQFEALRDPVLRKAALALEVMHERLRNGNGQGHGNGDQASSSRASSVDPGAVGVSRLSISGPPPGAPGGGNGDDVHPREE